MSLIPSRSTHHFALAPAPPSLPSAPHAPGKKHVGVYIPSSTSRTVEISSHSPSLMLQKSSTATRMHSQATPRHAAQVTQCSTVCPHKGEYRGCLGCIALPIPLSTTAALHLHHLLPQCGHLCLQVRGHVSKQQQQNSSMFSCLLSLRDLHRC